MKNMIKENADVLGLNSVSLSISFTTLHEVLQITLLVVSIIYTVDRFIYYRNKRKYPGKTLQKAASQGSNGLFYGKRCESCK